jgi:predicted dehydrogenase/aryl-alcohol dehydrogenase-like predicted oxidoreductase
MAKKSLKSASKPASQKAVSADTSPAKLRWGVLGTGAISKTFARGVLASQHCTLAAVGSRSAASAAKFLVDVHAPAGVAAHASYAAVLADPSVQAVYIGLPHPLHAQWACLAAAAGKHLLVEKPIGMNHAEAMAVDNAATVNNVFLMEAFMYRCHPQTAKLVELVRSKAIGELRAIDAKFSFHWPKPFHADSRLTNPALGGGGILDVGGYPVSLARLLAGAADGQLFANPVDLVGQVSLTPSGVDGHAAAVLRFASGLLATVTCGVQVNQENHVTLYGTDGKITVTNPWIPKEREHITIHRSGPGYSSEERLDIHTPHNLYSLEADEVARCIAAGLTESPLVPRADTRGLMQNLDQWRKGSGGVSVVYESEKLENFRPVPDRKIGPITSRGTPSIPHAKVPGLDKPVSRLIVGGDFAGWNYRDCFLTFDAYFEAGGNTIDTSWIYGAADRHIGAWLKSRGMAGQALILGKGAHTPYCTPAYAEKQIHESIANLGVKRLDIYCYHRDNLAVPVGEFVDLCSRMVRSGKIGAWGGSNWTTARLKQAIAYASKNNLVPPTIVSNQLSLAVMENPIWADCYHVHAKADRKFIAENNMALLPWSSQARGFFVPGVAAPDKLENKELVNAFYSKKNFQRQQRCFEMAKKKGVHPIQLALAWVLNQPFPTFPLIGPRQISEVAGSLPGLSIKLTPKELAYLDLET